jgi:hypothetical protein
VELKLPLQPRIKYAGFRVVLQRLPNTQVSIQDLAPDALVDDGNALKFSVPSVSLRPGQYVLFVKGRNGRGEYEDVQYYAFGVEK